MSNTNEQGHTERTGGSGNSGTDWVWVVSAAVVLVVVLGGVYVVISRHNDSSGAGGNGVGVGAVPAAAGIGGSTSSRPATSPDSAAGTGGTAGATETPVESGWAERGCNGTPGAGGAPVSAPTEVTWQPVGVMSVPVSSTLGPRRFTGPLRQCFQHSPAGALMAATNIVQGAGASAAAAPAVLRAQMTPGPSREHELGQLDGTSTSLGSASPAGYLFGACTPTACNVSLLLFGDGVYEQLTLPMVWSGGDWLIDGAGPNLVPSVASTMPGGYVAWRPGS